MSFDWRGALPPGLTVERMDEDLRRLPGLDLPEDVPTTLAKWGAMDDPRFAGFGVVALDCTGLELAIASWATVDFIAACAALERAFASGMQQVNWTCDADNPGSIRAAEKLGLERIDEYNQAVLIMDEDQHMAFFERG